MDNSYHYTGNPIPAEPPWGRVSDAADCNLDRPAKTLPAILCLIGAVSQNELGGHPPAPCRPSVQDSPRELINNQNQQIATCRGIIIAEKQLNGTRRLGLNVAASRGSRGEPKRKSFPAVSQAAQSGNLEVTVK